MSFMFESPPFYPQSIYEVCWNKGDVAAMVLNVDGNVVTDLIQGKWSLVCPIFSMQRYKRFWWALECVGKLDL
ncbi:hypothetical protein TSUD_214860 [Trifolium subterraneum]|uniref:Uncharacterized protein n=1 Tax=Trifolium subterraneum TaxID=3900 RepID=A0A2Z6N4L8_TRISU|nr:hypothetical protein TSUD_214860 [Trifolium subterraneum]